MEQMVSQIRMLLGNNDPHHDSTGFLVQACCEAIPLETG